MTDWADEKARELSDDDHENYPGYWQQPAAIAAALRTARNDALEKAARRLDDRGVGSCERGSVDYSTGVFECRRLSNGDCNCSEFDEEAEAIRALKEPE